MDGWDDRTWILAAGGGDATDSRHWRSPCAHGSRTVCPTPFNWCPSGWRAGRLFRLALVISALIQSVTLA